MEAFTPEQLAVIDQRARTLTAASMKKYVRRITVAFVIFVVALGYVHQQADQPPADARALVAQQSIDSRAKNTLTTCREDVKFSLALRKAVDSEVAFIKKFPATEPPTKAQQLAQIESIPIPDCAARVAAVKSTKTG